jgi:hypothetical protein
MPTTASPPHVALIDQMAAEWQSIGRCPLAVGSMAKVAPTDEVLARLVLGRDGAPTPCPTPFDLLSHMHRARGRAQREEAAHLVRVLLREAADPFVSRMLVQALVPGLIGVAGKLQWGRGGPWESGEEFFGELVSTTWCVVQEWAGRDRRYAVLDLLNAIRCRVRRQLLRASDEASRTVGLDDSGEWEGDLVETGLEQLAHLFIDLQREGMGVEEIQVLYAQHVLGYSIAELAAITGRSRRVLYARRDRGRRRLCA